jgi:hypothetical protein
MLFRASGAQAHSSPLSTLPTRSADFQSAVSRICNPQPAALETKTVSSECRRIQFCDTADSKSALPLSSRLTSTKVRCARTSVAWRLGRPDKFEIAGERARFALADTGSVVGQLAGPEGGEVGLAYKKPPCRCLPVMKRKLIVIKEYGIVSHRSRRCPYNAQVNH